MLAWLSLTGFLWAQIDRADLVRPMERNGFQIAAEPNVLAYRYYVVFKVHP